ncbi:MAG: hypothetical protein RBT35_08575 [Bacteroidales bacterium]|nr:hypothetical protein [Bacteroidales bacterium]
MSGCKNRYEVVLSCNSFLRTLLIESAWQAIRMDPAMMQYYHSHVVNSKGHEVVIKVARKLLNRIRYNEKQKAIHNRSGIEKQKL